MPETGVLVTRPAGQAESLCARLEGADYRALHCPMIEIEALGAADPAQREMLLRLDQYQHLVFVSANAIRFGMEKIEHYWPQLPLGPNWFTMGRASAEQLREYGVEVQFPPADMTTEGLLQLAPLSDVAGERVLLVKGQGGRDSLLQVLSGRGARVDELETYRRVAPDLEPGYLGAEIQRNHVKALMLSSGEGLNNMVSLLDADERASLRDTLVVVPGVRVAEIARALGFRRIAQADNATDEKMFAALKEALPSGGTE